VSIVSELISVVLNLAVETTIPGSAINVLTKSYRDAELYVAAQQAMNPRTGISQAGDN